MDGEVIWAKLVFYIHSYFAHPLPHGFVNDTIDLQTLLRAMSCYWKMNSSKNAKDLCSACILIHGLSAGRRWVWYRAITWDELCREFPFPRIFGWNEYLHAIVYSQCLLGVRTEELHKHELPSFFGLDQIDKRQGSSSSQDSSTKQECEQVNSFSSPHSDVDGWRLAEELM